MNDNSQQEKGNDSSNNFWRNSYLQNALDLVDSEGYSSDEDIIPINQDYTSPQEEMQNLPVQQRTGTGQITESDEKLDLNPTEESDDFNLNSEFPNLSQAMSLARNVSPRPDSRSPNPIADALFQHAHEQLRKAALEQQSLQGLGVSFDNLQNFITREPR